MLVLGAAGGTLQVGAVWREVDERFGSDLTEHDREMLPSRGQRRWQNRLAWARHRLVMQGVLLPTHDAGRGVWSLSEQGWEQYERAMGVSFLDRRAPLPGQFDQVRAAVRAALERSSLSMVAVEAAAERGGVTDPATLASRSQRLHEHLIGLDTELSLNGMGFSQGALQRAMSSVTEFNALQRLAD